MISKEIEIQTHDIELCIYIELIADLYKRILGLDFVIFLFNC